MLLLVPVTDVLQEIHQALDNAPSGPPDAEELNRLARLATRYVFESEVLLTYVMLIAGKPRRN